MEKIKSATFGWKKLLDYNVGQIVHIECNNFRDAESKFTLCKMAIKRNPEQFEEIGVGSLEVHRLPGYVVEVELQPIEMQ